MHDIINHVEATMSLANHVEATMSLIVPRNDNLKEKAKVLFLRNQHHYGSKCIRHKIIKPNFNLNGSKLYLSKKGNA